MEINITEIFENYGYIDIFKAMKDVIIWENTKPDRLTTEATPRNGE